MACNSVGKKDQGIAGSLIGTLQLYATSTGLGFAGVVERRIAARVGGTTVDGYRGALYLGMGLAGIALAIGVLLVWGREDAEPDPTDNEP